MFALGLFAAATAGGDSTTLSVAAASVTVSGSSATSLNFPVTRSGDLTYDLYLNFITADGTAVAGTDYSAAAGTLHIAAGSASSTVPVAVAGSSTNKSDRSFQLQLLGAVGSSAAPSFGTMQSFAIGADPLGQPNPNSVVTADFNGDGKLDIAAVNYDTAGTVSVMLDTTAPGATTPSYSAQTAFATGSYPDAVTVADVNGDGKPDLLVGNNIGKTVSVLLNTTAPGATTPSFAAQQTFATGTTAVVVKSADLNGDGRPDMVVVNFDSDTVSVLLNTTTPGATTPSFASQVTFATGHNPHGLAIADFNGDGVPDLAVANDNSNSLSVLLNTTAPGAATPSFSAATSLTASQYPLGLAAADLNGDGVPDLVVVNANSDSVGVFVNTTKTGATAASFAAQQSFAMTSGSIPIGVAVVDMDGDGKPDVVATGTAKNNLQVFKNVTAAGSSTISLGSPTTLASGNGPGSVFPADVNGDGGPDLIVANAKSNSVGVLLNTQYAVSGAVSVATGTIHYNVSASSSSSGGASSSSSGSTSSSSSGSTSSSSSGSTSSSSSGGNTNPGSSSGGSSGGGGGGAAAPALLLAFLAAALRRRLKH